jgi:hypothetical protein
MGVLFSYFLGASGLAFIFVRIFSFLFEGMLSPFRIFRRGAIGFRRHDNRRKVYDPDA